MIARCLTACLLILSVASQLMAATAIKRADDGVIASFDNGVVLRFALVKGHLLGLQTATVDGTALKSDQTVVRPFLIEEWKDKPVAWNDFVLADAKLDGDKVVLTLSAAGHSDKANESFFVMDAKTGKPHLDYYRFPHVQLPSDITRIEKLATQSDAAEASPPATIAWIIQPVTHNIAGFAWKGWQHHYEVTLPAGHKLNCLRELGTWETQGTANGNTLVALRYRGLGGLAPKLEPLDPADQSPDAPVKNAFTTTEILPGAVDKGPVVSPAVPGPQNISGREEALKYRHGAWICHPQRGGGANWIDFQYRPAVALASFYTRMDAIRSLTEVWPGDRQISYTDDLLFPLTDKFSTSPKTFIALVGQQPMADNEWHTRYQEMDLFVRDLVCKDLDMIQPDPLPSVGINWDSGWEYHIANDGIGRVDAFKAAGVKRVIAHHPGWFNGRGLRQHETTFPIPQSLVSNPAKPNDPPKLKDDTGGDCSIHDYIPETDKVRTLWRAFAQKLNENDMEYMVWVCGMIYGNGPIVKNFGTARFCRNSPEVDFSSGYPGSNGMAGHRGISMLDPDIHQWWIDRMNAASDDLGVSGFWADSFQNMYMSQMNYQRADWSPQVRTWWEWIAAESRKGVAFMSESTAFPGLTCSIEAGDPNGGYRGDEWTLLYSTRWYRGADVPFKNTAKADEIFFRSMANKGPIAPGGGNPSQIPSMKRLSDEYMASLPGMNRPYQLPDGSVLWLSFASDDAGVIFPFADAGVPDGVTAKPILGGDAVAKLTALHTFSVTGKDLLARFGLHRGSLADPRLGTSYVAPPSYRKDWSKDK